jgi:hypothetical protein
MWVAHFASLGERLGFANKQPPDAAPAVKLAA